MNQVNRLFRCSPIFAFVTFYLLGIIIKRASQRNISAPMDSVYAGSGHPVVVKPVPTYLVPKSLLKRLATTVANATAIT